MQTLPDVALARLSYVVLRIFAERIAPFASGLVFLKKPPMQLRTISRHLSKVVGQSCARQSITEDSHSNAFFGVHENNLLSVSVRSSRLRTDRADDSRDPQGKHPDATQR